MTVPGQRAPRLRLTRAAWIWLLVGVSGSAALWWFCRELQATSGFTGTPPRGAASPDLMASVVTSVMAVVWAALSLTVLRERGRWVVTKAQAARLAADLAGADARSAARHEARRQDSLRRTITDTMAGMTRLHAMENEYGDPGIAAFILGIPVEDVLKVTGRDG